MTGELIKVRDMTKIFGNNFYALKNFSCDIPSGVTGLLGPNGAGKTTFIRCLLGIIPFVRGNVQFLDHWELPRDIQKVKDIIGYQPEKDTRMLKTTAMKYVTHFGRLSGLPYEHALQRSFDVLHYVGLEEARYRDMNGFSSGMLQRVKLATALVQDPLLLVLDEPTAGMDVGGREKMLNLIYDLGHNHDKHIILSTHLLPDIERTANYVVVVNRGEMIAQGNLEDILERKDAFIPVKIRTSGNIDDFAVVLEHMGYPVVKENHDELRVMIEKANQTEWFLEIFKLAKKHGFDIRTLSPHKQLLEDVFINILEKDNMGET